MVVAACWLSALLVLSLLLLSPVVLSLLPKILKRLRSQRKTCLTILWCCKLWRFEQMHLDLLNIPHQRISNQERSSLLHAFWVL
jgi:hypothetical protein